MNIELKNVKIKNTSEGYIHYVKFYIKKYIVISITIKDKKKLNDKELIQKIHKEIYTENIEKNNALNLRVNIDTTEAVKMIDELQGKLEGVVATIEKMNNIPIKMGAKRTSTCYGS